MTLPRAGRWLKLDRGKEHLKALQAELKSVLASDQPQLPVSCSFDPHDQSWVCTTGEFQRVGDPVVGVLIGDVVHNFRSALDHLVWDLAVLDHGAWPMDSRGQEWRTQFPICVQKDGPSGFDSARIQSGQLDSISEEHRNQIERFQPYVTGKDALSQLARISNADKHRVVQTIYSTDVAAQPYVLGTSDCALAEELGRLPIIQGPLEPDTEILRLPLSNVGPHPHVDVMFEVAIFVTFRDGRNVANVLGQAAEAVEEILREFEPDLETAKAQAIRDAADAPHF